MLSQESLTEFEAELKTMLSEFNGHTDTEATRRTIQRRAGELVTKFLLRNGYQFAIEYSGNDEIEITSGDERAREALEQIFELIELNNS